MSKRKSLINPTIICMLIGAIVMFNVSYKTFEYHVGDAFGAIEGRRIVAISGGVGGAFAGLLLAFVAHLFFRPSHTNRLLKEQNRMLNNNKYQNNSNRNNKVDELNKLNELKKSGVLSEQEFRKLKTEIVDRK